MEESKIRKGLSELYQQVSEKHPELFKAKKNLSNIPYTEFLDILCCPKCHGDLAHSKDHFACTKCKLAFNINNGIPDFRIDIGRI